MPPPLNITGVSTLNTKKVGKITLALTLIFLGVVLLFRTRIDVLEILEVYIPAALIMLGLEILVSKAYYEKKGYQVKADIGSIVLTVIIALVVGGVLFTFRIFEGNMMNIDIPNFNIINEARYRYGREVDGSIESEAGSKMKLDTGYSDVEVLRADGETVKVEGRVNYRYNDEGSSNLKLEDFVSVRKNGDTLEISYNKREIEKLHRIGIEDISYRVYVPEGVEAIATDVSYSSLSVRDLKLKSSEIKADYGELYISNVDGDYRVSGNYTDISIDGVQGDAEANSNYGDLEVKNVSGKIVSKVTYSDLDIYNSKATQAGLKVDGSYSDISIDLPSSQTGKFDVKVKFGELDMGKFKGIPGMNISGENAEGRVGNSDIPIEVSMEMGDINFE